MKTGKQDGAGEFDRKYNRVETDMFSISLTVLFGVTLWRRN